MKRDVLWNSLGTAAWSFLSLALLIVVTRINGVTDSGHFSFAFALALVMYTVASYGVRTYQVSDHHGIFSTDSYIGLRTITVAIAAFITLVFVAVNGYGWGKSALIFVLVGHRLLDAASDVFHGALQKNGRLYIAGKSLFYKSVLSLVAFVVVDVLTQNLLLSSLALPGVSLLFLLFYDIPKCKAVENFRFVVQGRESLKILSALFLPFSVAILSLVFANVSRYFIDLHHPELQGYFGIIIMPLSLIILLFSFVSTPAIMHISNMYNNGEMLALRRLIAKIVGITSLATLLVLCLTYLFGVPVLNALFNLDFAPYLVDVLLIVVIGLALSLTSLFTQVATVARKLRVAALAYMLATLLLVGLCFLLVEQYAIRGVIVAYALSALVQLCILGAYYWRITRRSYTSAQRTG